MRGTEFEFRNRFWIITAIFWLGFSVYRLDPVNAASAAGAWVAARLGRPEAHSAQIVLGVGALITLIAAAIRTWASSFLRSSVVHDRALHSERLVADGPYRYVRNPLYVGVILLGVGMGLLASRLGFAVIVVGLTLFTLRLIGREEAELTASQGESYRRYLSAVPRLVPSLFPRVPKGGGRSHWRQAFAGEVFMWGMAASVVVFAITLKVEYFWIVLAASLFFRFVHAAILKRQGAAVGN